MDAAATDLDLSQLRERQVKVLSHALNQFVALKSSPEGWQPVAPAGGISQAASMGGDVDVHIGKKPAASIVGGSSSTCDVYRMTASIPLDPDISKDTQGPFSAYLSELRDWQAVLECPGIRSMWNYYIRSCSTLEMLDSHTSITRSVLRSPVPGQTKAFAHERDMLMVETSLVDPTTVVYISTSLPTTPDDPAYLRECVPFKRVNSDIWAWCVEIVTPIDAIPHSTQPTLDVASHLRARGKPRVCVQVTCFLHLELGSWKSNNALACRAAANLIPSLVAHLRLHGAPPRIARIGPSIAIDRREWHRPQGDTPLWEVSYSVMCTPPSLGHGQSATVSGILPPPLLRSKSNTFSIEQPIIASILDLESASNGNRFNSTEGGRSTLSHARKVSSLTSYLSSSFQRRQVEASAYGTHAGGIVRDGEEFALVVTRAKLGSCILEFVVDASNWRSEGHSVEIALSLSGFASAQQLYTSIYEMHAAAPELFTKSQLELSLDDITHGQNEENNGCMQQRDRLGLQLESRTAKKQNNQRLEIAELAARQLVRCFYIASHKNARHRYLVRIMNPPTESGAGVDDESLVNGNDQASQLSSNDTVDKAYRVSVVVRKGLSSNSTGILVNGCCVEISPFTLDPPTHATAKHRVGSANPPQLPVINESNTTITNGLRRHSTPQVDHTPTPMLLQQPAQNINIPNKNADVSDMSSSKDNIGDGSGSNGSYSGEGLVGATSYLAVPTLEAGEIEGGQSTNALGAIDLHPINRASTNNLSVNTTFAAATEEAVNIHDIPFVRLRQVNIIPSADWNQVGTAGSGGVTISRAEIHSTAPSHIQQSASLSVQNRTSDSDSEANDNVSAAAIASISDKNRISGTVLRAEALVEGWTIFDVFSVLCSIGGLDECPASGLWTKSQILEQQSPNTMLYHYKASGSWASAARDAIVCQVWSTNSRSRIDIAECSVDELLSADEKVSLGVDETNGFVRADLGLAGWKLEKSKLPAIVADRHRGDSTGGDRERGAVSRMSFGILSGANIATGQALHGSLAASAARLRSGSVTGSPAIDAEFESQRRKQHVVKITHYLKYNPRGWLNPNNNTVVSTEDVAAGFKRIGTALGFNVPEQQQQQIRQEQKQNTSEAAIFQAMLLPGLKDALVNDITRIVKHLDNFGAQPAVVWSRNANILNVGVSKDCVQFQYRMAGWGTPRQPFTLASSSASSAISPSQRANRTSAFEQRVLAMSGLPDNLEDNEFIEVEFRIEHRVWAYGLRADGTERTLPAAIDITIEPFYETSSVACFVDPETDPHATRVRVRHHRSQLLPRVEEADSAIFMAWPTVHLAVARKQKSSKRQLNDYTSNARTAAADKESAKQMSSLVVPKLAAGSTSALVLPWSVPPRITVNSVVARVRYLRRDDSSVHGFYARCLSISAHDAAKLARASPPIGELFMERLPDPSPQHGDIQQAVGSEELVPADTGDDGGEQFAHVSRIAIQKYSVHSTEYRVATPNQFASIMTGVFARIRHEIELMNPQSPRYRWNQIRNKQRLGSHFESDARSVASLVTAIADERWWSMRERSSHYAVYERIVDGLHSEIPVTVAVNVLQGVSAEQVAQLLENSWERSSWDSTLFVGQRRELEYVPDSTDEAFLTSDASGEHSEGAIGKDIKREGAGGSGGGVSIYYSSVYAPLFCDKRDALTVKVSEQAAFYPTRQRLRNWERQNGQPAASYITVSGTSKPRNNSKHVKCENMLGDYYDPTFTLVEASIPGSQPLSTVTRAHLSLFAVRIDPIDAFERVSGQVFAYPSCRITVACCLDLAGTMPLPFRRAASAKIPEQHIDQIKARLQTIKAQQSQQQLCKPLWPHLVCPSYNRRVVPQTKPSGRENIVCEVSEEIVDGQRLAFYRSFDRARILHEAIVGQRDSKMYVTIVALPDLTSGSPERVALERVNARLCSLRKDGGFSAPDIFPQTETASATSPAAAAWVSAVVPVVSDVIVDGNCFPHGFDVHVTAVSGNSHPMVAECSSEADVCSRIINNDGSISSNRGSGVFVADEAAAIPAGRWVASSNADGSSRSSINNGRIDEILGGHRLAVYVFIVSQEISAGASVRPAQNFDVSDTTQVGTASTQQQTKNSDEKFLVRTVLLPPDQDGLTEVGRQQIAGNGSSAEAAACTVVIRAASDGGSSQAQATTTLYADSLAPKMGGIAVSCNRQRLRVHCALPSKQSLLFVSTSAGKYINMCRECGGFTCNATNKDTAATIGYASDTDEVLDFGEDLVVDSSVASIQQRRRSSSWQITGRLLHAAMAKTDRNNQQFAASKASMLDSQPSPPYTPAISSRKIKSDTHFRATDIGSGLATTGIAKGQENTIRQRRIVTATTNSSSVGSAVTEQVNRSVSVNDNNSIGISGRVMTAPATLNNNGSGYYYWRAELARIFCWLLAFAVFLPVRRLVIGRSVCVGQWLEQQQQQRVAVGTADSSGNSSKPKESGTRAEDIRDGDGQQHQELMPRWLVAKASKKSTVALALVLAAGGFCLYLGIVLASVIWIKTNAL
ncbi:hypothetical protein BX070DRAFT_224596 [Coemansia spiralis]|nr:hypothetical protein BX070DRAFT_224596 [Coemansia spiralis]